MKPDHNKILEEAIHRELEKLPDLQAPEMLASRVMAAIEQRAVLPWYRRPWQAWPTGLQTASFVLLVAFFAALCFGGWKLSQGEIVIVATQQIGEWFSIAGVIWNTLSVLASSLLLLLKQLNPILLTACAVMAFFSYAACVGLGTAFFRYAFVRRQENHL
jgi:hypothetical protein